LILPDLDRSQKARIDPDVDRQAREWEEILQQKFALERRAIAKVGSVSRDRSVHSGSVVEG